MFTLTPPPLRTESVMETSGDSPPAKKLKRSKHCVEGIKTLLSDFNRFSNLIIFYFNYELFRISTHYIIVMLSRTTTRSDLFR